MDDVNTKTPHTEKYGALLCKAFICCEQRAELVHELHNHLSAALGLVSTALRASGVTGDGCATLRALAELGSLPGLGGQAGALLHLGRSAFRSCHSIVFVLRFTVM